MGRATWGWAAVAVFAVASFFSAAADAQTPPSVYLRIDGRYYAGTLPPPPITYLLSIRFLTALNFPGMRDCQRPGGVPPRDGAHTLAFGTNVAPTGVGANTFRTLLGNPLIIDVASVTGDVVCVGAITPPDDIVVRVTGRHPTRLFSSGFESTDALPKGASPFLDVGSE